jgi:hypothetical protein
MYRAKYETETCCQKELADFQKQMKYKNGIGDCGKL